MNYAAYDGLGLAALVKRGEVSALELLEEAIRRIELHNPALNAVVTRLYDQARQSIASGQLPRGPFEGVPFLIKELVVSVAGSVTTSSSRLFAGHPAAFDSEVVARYRRAGLVIVGKTNSSELGVLPTTESALYGVSRNPWNTNLSPGGSSGGSAAAVAAGMVPAAHASDGGGSIRIPASCCGLFGLKPTRARATSGPEIGDPLNGLANQHAVTRSVRDSAALLDAIAGPMLGDPYAAPPPGNAYLRQIQQPPPRLRIAFSRTAPGGGKLAADCVDAVESAARLCESLGHHVEEAQPQWDTALLLDDFTTVFAVNTMANIARVTGGAIPPAPLTGAMVRAIAQHGQTVSGVRFVQALQSLHRQARRIAQFFGDYDIWLTPTLAQTPPPIGAGNAEDAPAPDDLQRWLDGFENFTCFNYPFNATGQPAASVPLHWTAAGIPIGCQFAARYGEEGLLLRLCAQLEAARPWFARAPGSVGQ